MSTGILIALVVVAGLACPLMMWWQNRRGRAAACCMPVSPKPGETDLDELRARQKALASKITEFEGREPQPTDSAARLRTEVSPPRG